MGWGGTRGDGGGGGGGRREKSRRRAAPRRGRLGRCVASCVARRVLSAHLYAWVGGGRSEACAGRSGRKGKTQLCEERRRHFTQEQRTAAPAVPQRSSRAPQHTRTRGGAGSGARKRAVAKVRARQFIAAALFLRPPSRTHAPALHRGARVRAQRNWARRAGGRRRRGGTGGGACAQPEARTPPQPATAHAPPRRRAPRRAASRRAQS